MERDSQSQRKHSPKLVESCPWKPSTNEQQLAPAGFKDFKRLNKKMTLWIWTNKRYQILYSSFVHLASISMQQNQELNLDKLLVMTLLWMDWDSYADKAFDLIADFKSNTSKVGLNLLVNRLSILNGKIPLIWLNETMTSFKLKCKRSFLNNWIFLKI